MWVICAVRRASTPINEFFFVRDKDKAHTHIQLIYGLYIYKKVSRFWKYIWRVTFFSLELISIRQISIIIILGNIFARLIYAEGKNKLSVIYKLDISRIWRSSIYGAFVCMFFFPCGCVTEPVMLRERWQNTFECVYTKKI